MPPDRPRDLGPRKQSVSQWIRENFGDVDRDVISDRRARELRAQNQARFAASQARTQKPARVS